MKKFGIIVILLLVIAAGGIGAAHFVIDRQQHDVTIAETTLSGDKREADGVFVKTKYEDAMNTVNWWTTYSMTEDKVVECEMDMENNEWTEDEPGVSLQIDFPDYSNTGYEGNSFIEAADEITEHYGIPKDVLLEARSSAENGKMTTTTYALTDYLDYMTITFSIWNLPLNYAFSDLVDEDENALDYSYFKMPIPKGAKANLKITKNTAGEITFWHFNLENPYYCTEADGVLDETSLYLATSGFGMPGDTAIKHIVDMPDETRGIHHIPLTLDNRTYYPDLQKAKLVYALEPEEAVLRLKKGITADTLLLYTEKQNALWLSIINKETMECRQKMKLMEKTSKIFDIYQDDHYILTLADNGDFVLLDMATETYQIKLRGNVVKDFPSELESLETAYYDSTACAVDYDGQRLAFAFFLLDDEGYTQPIYILQVFDKSGLTYMGRFESSLTNDTEPHGIGISLNSSPIEVSFEGFDN